MVKVKKAIKEHIAIIAVFAVALAVLTGCATSDGGDEHGLSLEEAIARSAAALAAKLPAGTRVAVAAFESPHGNLSGYIMDELVDALTEGSLEVADRNNLEYVYRELDLQTKDMNGENDRNTQSVGAFLGAQYVVTGQLVDTGGGYRYRLNGINVETAVHESSTRLDVRNDRRFQELAAALLEAAPEVRTARYDADGAAAPRTAGTFLDRGIMFASRGEYEAAIEDFTEALKLDPDMVAAWMLRGRAMYASASRVTGIGENFISIGTTITKTPVDPVVGITVSDARKAVYDRAVSNFTQAIRLDPGNARAYKDRAGVYRNLGDYDRAVADLTQAIQLDPGFAEAYHNRGVVYSNKREYDNAVADLTQAMRLAPDKASPYYNRGEVYYNQKEYDKAIADLDHAIRLNPGDALAYNERGLAYSGKGEYDRAIADYNQSIRLDPDDITYNNRGVAYARKGEYDKAIADYTQAIQVNPNGDLAYLNRAYAYKTEGEYDKAIADYTQVIHINPNNAGTYVDRGRIYDTKGEYDSAIADYNLAIRLNPRYANAYSDRGIAYYNKREYDSAIADFSQVIRLNPNRADAYSWRGIAYYSEKDYARARADFEKALEINPGHANARQWLEYLQKKGY